MGRVYATTDDGERVSVRLECDATGCDARIAPGPAIATSGWVKGGFGSEPGEVFCPEHQSECWARYGYPGDGGQHG